MVEAGRRTQARSTTTADGVGNEGATAEPRRSLHRSATILLTGNEVHELHPTSSVRDSQRGGGLGGRRRSRQAMGRARSGTVSVGGEGGDEGATAEPRRSLHRSATILLTGNEADVLLPDRGDGAHDSQQQRGLGERRRSRQSMGRARSGTIIRRSRSTGHGQM